jgi:hypothetical protein
MVALSVCVLQAQALAFHVHSVPEHGRSTHHSHAPAVHHHHLNVESGGKLKFTAADEIGPAVVLSVPAATATFVMTADAVVTTGPWLARPAPSALRVSSLDVRSHGPPRMWRPSFRGPPILLTV